MDIKKYKKDEYTVFESDYFNLDDFLTSLITKKINYQIFPYPYSIYGNAEFTGTNSFEEAWNLCKYTYDEGFQEFNNDVCNVNLKFININKKNKTYSVVGSSPNVQRYLIGIPDSMRRKKEICAKKTINIYLSAMCNCSTTHNQIRNRGILTLSFINYLEQVKNYKVKLNFFGITENDNEIIYIKVPLKKENQKINIKKCYFPIVHSSFFRRLLIRADEIIPNIQSDWNTYYGTPLSYQKVLSILNLDFNNDIYISTPQELNIRGYSLEEDAINFVNKINEKYNLFDDDVLNKTKKRK